MNTEHLTSGFDHLTHGWNGLFLGYGLISIFVLVGLKRAGGGFKQYLYWPATSLFTMFLGFLALGILWSVIEHYHLTVNADSRRW